MPHSASVNELNFRSADEAVRANKNGLPELAVATAIIALVSVLPVVAVAILGPEIAAWGGFFGPGTFFTGPGFTWLSTYIPIEVLYTALGSRIAFYFGVRALETIFAGVVKMLIGV